MKRGRVAFAIGMGAAAIVVCAATAGTAASDGDRTSVVVGMLASWQSALERGARTNPTSRYPNPPRKELIARLRASVGWGFKLLSIRMRHPLQDAPVVIVKVHPLARNRGNTDTLLVDLLAALKSSDGKQLYEGFFVEALDNGGTPFYARWLASRAQVSEGWNWRQPCGAHCLWLPGYPWLIDLPLCGGKMHPSKVNSNADPCAKA